MADSISHSDFIVVAQRGINRNAHINQRAEHSSPQRENLRLTRTTHAINERSGARLVFPVRPGTVSAMNKTVIEVQVRAVLPTSGGCAVFLGNNEKVFIIYVDQTVGSAITMFMIRQTIVLTNILLLIIVSSTHMPVMRARTRPTRYGLFAAGRIDFSQNDGRAKHHEHCDGATDGLIDVDDENLLIVAKENRASAARR